MPSSPRLPVGVTPWTGEIAPGKHHLLLSERGYADAERELVLAADVALDVSVYSLIAVASAAAPLMTEGGGIVTMTYYGAEKVVPKYNVMGVAKAALEASVRYLASDLAEATFHVLAQSDGADRTKERDGNGQQDDEGKHKTFVLRGEREVHDEQTQAEQNGCFTA